MTDVVVTAVAAVVVVVALVDVVPELRPFAPQAGSNASAVSEADRPHKTCRRWARVSFRTAAPGGRGAKRVVRRKRCHPRR